MLFDLIRYRDSLMCKREAGEVKLFNRWICCTFHAAGSCVQCFKSGVPFKFASNGSLLWIAYYS